MENVVTKGAKPAEPMPKLTTGGIPPTVEDLGGPTPENYKPDDDSAKLKDPSATLKQVKDVVNKGAKPAEAMPKGMKEEEVEVEGEVVGDDAGNRHEDVELRDQPNDEQGRKAVHLAARLEADDHILPITSEPVVCLDLGVIGVDLALEPEHLLPDSSPADFCTLHAHFRINVLFILHDERAVVPVRVVELHCQLHAGRTKPGKAIGGFDGVVTHVSGVAVKVDVVDFQARHLEQLLQRYLDHISAREHSRGPILVVCCGVKGGGCASLPLRYARGALGHAVDA